MRVLSQLTLLRPNRHVLPGRAPRADARSSTPLRALLAANAVSSLGNSLNSLALPWFVLQTTDSAGKMGLTSACFAIGGMVAAFFTGPLVDAFGFRRSSVLADIGCGTLMASIPLLHMADVLTFPLLLIIAFCLACFGAPGDSARFALVPGFATAANVERERANAMDRGIARGALLVGPLLAGLLIALMGPSNVLLLDAATFGVSAVIIGVWAGGTAAADGTQLVPTGAAPSYARQLRAGASFVRRNPVIFAVVSLAAVCNTIDAALLTVVLPSYAGEIWGSTAVLGAVVSALGAGALLGTLLFGRVGRKLPRRTAMLGGGAVGALLLYGALALTPAVGVVLFAAFLGGVVGGPIYPLMETLVQGETPPDMYGRVFGALGAFSVIGVPFGTVAAGLLVDGPGVVTTIVLMGGCYLVVTLGAFALPAFRPLDRSSPPTDDGLIAPG